jgi:hypothetical protein
MIILMVLLEIGVNMHPPLGDNKNYTTLPYSGGVFCFNPPTPLFYFNYIPYLCLMDNKSKILKLPDLDYNGGWEGLQTILNYKKNVLFSIEGDLDLKRTPIQSLGNLVSVGGSLDLSFSDIESLGNLQSVGGDLDLYGTKIESLGNLESVGGYLDLGGTKIESLWNLKEVGGNLNLYDTPIEYLGNLESVGGELDLRGTPLSAFGYKE